MLFHSLQFLLFLPIVFALYWGVARQAWQRKVLLLVASLIFYMAWNPLPVLLLLWLTTVDWLVGRLLARATTTRARRAALLVSIVNNLGALFLFKYADWVVRSVCAAASLVGVTLVYRSLGLLLPIGLSFLVFQGLSYTIDVYRGTLTARRSWLDVATFMTFFPHVVAGPIVRAADFLPQLDKEPVLREADGARAIFRIAMGMWKKLVIADFLSANLVDRVFGDPGNHSGLEVTTAIFGYTLQIYYDFSAYSDIAIGTAALLGFVLKENFDKPYLSVNLFEFWRRWHMSLGSWLRDYLYIPLGGNRDGRARVMFNLLVTMVLGGIWHGADWRFAIWGLAHGVGLCLTRAWWWSRGRPKNPSFTSQVMSGLVTFLLVMEARVVFRARDVSHAWSVFREQAKATWHAPNLTPLLLLVLAAAVVGHLLPHRLYDRLGEMFGRLPVPARAVALVGLALVIKGATSFEVQPFIYGQF